MTLTKMFFIEYSVGSCRFSMVRHGYIFGKRRVPYAVVACAAADQGRAGTSFGCFFLYVAGGASRMPGFCAFFEGDAFYGREYFRSIVASGAGAPVGGRHPSVPVVVEPYGRELSGNAVVCPIQNKNARKTRGRGQTKQLHRKDGNADGEKTENGRQQAENARYGRIVCHEGA